jgi:hypothetical protein
MVGKRCGGLDILQSGGESDRWFVAQNVSYGREVFGSEYADIHTGEEVGPFDRVGCGVWRKEYGGGILDSDYVLQLDGLSDE